MPTIKIELQKGLTTQQLINIKNAVVNAVVNTLQLPQTDRNIRIIEYEPHLFEMKPPYQMLIEISMFAGRTNETKRKLFKTIVDDLHNSNLFNKNNILITLNEQPLENWGGR